MLCAIPYKRSFLGPNFAIPNLQVHPGRLRYREASPIDTENLTNNPPYLENSAIYDVCIINTYEVAYGFRLVPKMVTLNNLEQNNGLCALFQRIR